MGVVAARPIGADVMGLTELTLPYAHTWLPRIDLVYRRREKSPALVVVGVIYGKPTAGATLQNLNGAPALPDGFELLGYVLVGPGGSCFSVGVPD